MRQNVWFIGPICIFNFQNDFRVETKMFVFAFLRKLLGLRYCMKMTKLFANLSPTCETKGLFLWKQIWWHEILADIFKFRIVSDMMRELFRWFSRNWKFFLKFSRKRNFANTYETSHFAKVKKCIFITTLKHALHWARFCSTFIFWPNCFYINICRLCMYMCTFKFPEFSNYFSLRWMRWRRNWS